MKYTKLLLVGLIVSIPLSSLAATGCEGKRQNIEQEIEYARQHGNNNRIAGLEKALSEVKANCTDDKLRTEREEKVREKEQKVEERKQELLEAQADGRENKIAKKQDKLEEAQEELEEAKSMLD